MVLNDTVSPCRDVGTSVPIEGMPNLLGILSHVQAKHELYGRLHLYHAELKRKEGERVSVRTVCGKWKCGCPDTPTRFAAFYEAFDTIPLVALSFSALECEPCGDCFHERVLFEHHWRAFIPTKEELMLDPLSGCSDEVSDSSVESEE